MVPIWSHGSPLSPTPRIVEIVEGRDYLDWVGIIWMLAWHAGGAGALGALEKALGHSGGEREDHGMFGRVRISQ